MLHVDRVVHGLGEATGDRLSNAERAIEKFPTEKRIMNEVVADAIDVGVDHQRINEPEKKHHPKRRVRIQKEQADKVGEMKKSGRGGQDVPARVREDPRIRRRPFGPDYVSVHGGRYHSRKSSLLASF